jgi:hypothetical protein
VLDHSLADPVAAATWRDGAEASSLAEAFGGRGGIVVRDSLMHFGAVRVPDETWPTVKSVARRAPVVVVFDESMPKNVPSGVRTDGAGAASRAAEARRIVGAGVPFVGVDPMRSAAAMPATHVVVNRGGRVVFASDDLELVGAAAERLLVR